MADNKRPEKSEGVNPDYERMPYEQLPVITKQMFQLNDFIEMCQEYLFRHEFSIFEEEVGEDGSLYIMNKHPALLYEYIKTAGAFFSEDVYYMICAIVNNQQDDYIKAGVSSILTLLNLCKEHPQYMLSGESVGGGQIYQEKQESMIISSSRLEEEQLPS